MSMPPEPGAASGAELDVGGQMRAARQAQGLSIREAARRLGCSPRFVHQLEQGKPTARLDKVRQAAAGLGLHLSLTSVATVVDPERAARVQARANLRLREEKLARAHDRIATRLALGELGPPDIARARAQVAKWETHGICGTWYVERWTALLRGSARQVAARLIRLGTEDARALYQNTPFGFVVRGELRP